MSNMYTDEHPYIFISYAHKDTDIVLPIIRRLMSSGFHVWYDDGIECGKEWPEYIATKIYHAACVMAFITPNSVNSKNCRREINFAIAKDKDLLTIYLEKFELPLGLQMQLDTLHALFHTDHSSDEVFWKKIESTPLLQQCRTLPDPSSEPERTASPVKQSAKTDEPVPTVVAETIEAPEVPVSTDITAPASSMEELADIFDFHHWSCSCGQSNPVTAGRCPCGRWRCICGKIHAGNVSNCACGKSKQDFPYYLTETHSAAPAVDIVVDIDTPIPKDPPSTPVPIQRQWQCTCGRIHAANVSSCVCGKSKRDILDQKTSHDLPADSHDLLDIVTDIHTAAPVAKAPPAPVKRQWQCSCGRVHAVNVSSCVCGKSKWDLY